MSPLWLARVALSCWWSWWFLSLRLQKEVQWTEQADALINIGRQCTDKARLPSNGGRGASGVDRAAICLKWTNQN